MSSRATMFTGLPSSEHGVRTNGCLLDDTYPTLPQILKDNGYTTMSTGKLHLSTWELGALHAPGFDVDSIPVGKYPELELHWKDGRYDHIPDGYFGLDNIDFIGGHGWFVHGDYTNWLRDNHPEEYEKFVSRQTLKPTLNYDDPRYGNVYATIKNECYYNEWIKDRTIEKIDKLRGDKPFFAWVSFPDPHWPYGPPAPYNEMYDPNKIEKPLAWDDDKATMPDFFHKEYYEERGIFSLDGQDTTLTLDQIMEAKALSYGMTTSIDDCIGQVVDHLKEIGEYENTIFVFMSDHGEAMGDHHMFNKGPFHYESVIRIPFIVSYPKKQKEKGMVSEAMVQTMDFMPTVLDLAGVEYPCPELPDWQGFFPEKFHLYDSCTLSRLPGNSLAPIMAGEKEEIQDYVLVEDDDDVRGIMVRTLVCKDYKLIVFMDREDGVLFDYSKDPNELNNVWSDPEYAEVKAMMMERMTQALLRNLERQNRRISCA
jgi:arylsulfatase